MATVLEEAPPAADQAVGVLEPPCGLLDSLLQQAAGSRQQAEGSRQQAEGSRQQAAGSRQRAAGSILHSSLNIPSAFEIPRSSVRNSVTVRPEGNLSDGYLQAKRAFDVVGAALLLVPFAPVMAAAWLVLLVATRGKPIFRQVRLGHCGRPFTMYKFRTMTNDAISRQGEVRNEKDGPIFKNRRDPRTTRIGRFLRRTSIDETPQLINVLLGHMSLVGPRPPLEAEVAKYETWQRRRLSVKPGLTCLWQVSGRSEIAFEHWVRMDLWYVRNQDLWTDLTLLVKTPWSVLSRRGAY